jgi:hypothetical protein
VAEQGESGGVATTALFVELVVIGVGTAGAGAVALAAAIGWDWLKAASEAGPLVLGGIAVVYVLGIVVDRIADAVFEPLTDRWRWRIYPATAQPARDYRADLLAVIGQAPLASRLAYGRSRLRVCRGWAMNCVLAAVALVVYVLTLPSGQGRLGLALGGETALLVLAAGCLYACRSLAITQYRQVWTQAAALESTGSAGPSTDAQLEVTADPVA